MGLLHYGSPPVSFELDDRLLSHVELVVIAKLRRNENFALTIDQGDTRQTLWVSSSTTLRFERGTEAHEINREWLDELIDAANTTIGLRMIPEPVKG